MLEGFLRDSSWKKKSFKRQQHSLRTRFWMGRGDASEILQRDSWEDSRSTKIKKNPPPKKKTRPTDEVLFDWSDRDGRRISLRRPPCGGRPATIVHRGPHKNRNILQQTKKEPRKNSTKFGLNSREKNRYGSRRMGDLNARTRKNSVKPSKTR